LILEWSNSDSRVVDAMMEGTGRGGGEDITCRRNNLNLEWSCFLVLNFWTWFLQQGLKNSLSLKSLGKHSSLWVVGLNLSQRWGPRFHTDQCSVPRYHKPSQDLVLDFLRTSPFPADHKHLSGPKQCPPDVDPAKMPQPTKRQCPQT
jgi:hypothetical protein